MGVGWKVNLIVDKEPLEKNLGMSVFPNYPFIPLGLAFIGKIDK